MLVPMAMVLEILFGNFRADFCTIVSPCPAVRLSSKVTVVSEQCFPSDETESDTVIPYSNALAVFNHGQTLTSRVNSIKPQLRTKSIQCVELYHGSIQSGGFYLEIGSRVIELERSYESTEMELFYSTSDLVPLHQPVFKVSLVWLLLFEI